MGVGEGWGASWRRWSGKGRRKEGLCASLEPFEKSNCQSSLEHQLHRLEGPPLLTDRIPNAR